MKKDKIINKDEIDLINLFKLLWASRFGIIFIFFISFAITLIFQNLSNSKYKISVKLTMGDSELVDRYIFLDSYMMSLKKNNSYKINNILFNNFNKISQKKEDIALFLKNNKLEKEGIEIKSSELPNNEYELFLYHININEGSRILRSFVKHTFFKAKNKTIVDLEIIANLDTNSNIFRNKDFDFKEELYYYIDLFENENIDGWFSFNSSKIKVSNTKTVGIFLFISMIIGIIMVIIYLVIINFIETKRN
jgi:hypothetical protein